MAQPLCFEPNITLEKTGKILGFLCSYFIFTTILYALLTLTKKLPASWSYGHVVLITLGILGLGFIIKRLLR